MVTLQTLRRVLILDDEQIVFARDGQQRIHVAGVAGEMNHEERAGFWRDAPTDVLRVEIVRVRSDVGEDRHALLGKDADDRAHVGHGRRDDL